MEKDRVHYFRPQGLSGIELLSCHDAGFDFPPHFHQAYCIWFNNTGGEHYSYRGCNDILQPGSFGIVAPGEVHANRSLDHSGRSLTTFYLSPEHLETLAMQIGGTQAGAIEFRSRFYQDAETLQALGRLFEILLDSNSTLEKESVFLETLYLLASRHAVSKPLESPLASDKRRVRSIIEFFQEHLSDNVSLGELAQRFDCTSFHLIRSFKKESGIPPYAYLLRLRLELARKLICQGRALVDVALETGFTDQSHLTRHFKALYGISPGAFRSQVSGF